MDDSKHPAPPVDLSAKSQRLWRDLMEVHSFRRDEVEHLTRALELADKGDELFAAGETKLGLDCRNAALRHWRLLKFTDSALPARRPGRPAGDDWSPQRRANAAEAHRRAAGGRAS